MSVNPINKILINIGYTYSHSKDCSTDSYLLKIPFNQGKAGLSWDFIEKTNLFLDLIFMGKRWDYGNKYLESYMTLNSGVSYYILENILISDI